MLIGYARISTQVQSRSLQNDALQKAGCYRIFQDVASGANIERPGLLDALSFCRPGDTLVVWKLDRLGRSIRHLIDAVTALLQKKHGFQKLTRKYRYHQRWQISFSYFFSVGGI